MEELSNSTELLESSSNLILFSRDGTGNKTKEEGGDDMIGILDKLSTNQILLKAELQLDAKETCDQLIDVVQDE